MACYASAAVAGQTLSGVPGSAARRPASQVEPSTWLQHSAMGVVVVDADMDCKKERHGETANLRELISCKYEYSSGDA